MNGLTKTQQRALAKLTHKKQCAYDLQESLPTLRALVSKGYAVMSNTLGGVAFPRTAIDFRLPPRIMVTKQGRVYTLIDGKLHWRWSSDVAANSEWQRVTDFTDYAPRLALSELQRKEKQA